MMGFRKKKKNFLSGSGLLVLKSTYVFPADLIALKFKLKLRIYKYIYPPAAGNLKKLTPNGARVCIFTRLT